MTQKPNKDSYAPYFHGYVEKAPDLPLLEALRFQHESTQRLLASIPAEQGDYRYAEGKWSIKELVCHLIDTERIFNARALRFARNDGTELPGYDHNAYVQALDLGHRDLASLAAEYAAVRASSIALYTGFSETELPRSGTASGNAFTVLAIGYIHAGHEAHHMGILQERYLSASAH